MDNQNIYTFAYMYYVSEQCNRAKGTPNENFWRAIRDEVFVTEIYQKGLLQEYVEFCRTRNTNF